MDYVTECTKMNLEILKRNGGRMWRWVLEVEGYRYVLGGMANHTYLNGIRNSRAVS